MHFGRRSRPIFRRSTPTTISLYFHFGHIMQSILLVLGLTLATGLASQERDPPYSPLFKPYWKANISEDHVVDLLHRGAATRDLCECGYSTLPNSRIVGGSQANDGEFPWQVQVKTIYYNRTARATYVGGCGGTIISSNWVLSATHCFVDNEERNNMDIQEVQILAGAVGKDKGTQYNAKGLNHADFNPRNMLHDLTLVSLQSPIKFSKTVGPACLPYQEKGSIDWTGKVWASGWGDLYYDGPGPDKMQKVVLDAISNEDCNNRGMDVQDSQICTYTRRKDTCQGDSGGPIAARLSNGKFNVMGVVSYGQGCAGPTPGVYTRVSAYIDAIESVTGEQYCKK